MSSPVCQTYLIDLYRNMTKQFRPELFDDSDDMYMTGILNRYIMLGGVFAKNTSRETKHILSRKTRHNMIYLFKYTEYYLEHWLNKYYNTLCLSFSGIFCIYWVGGIRNCLTCLTCLTFGGIFIFVNFLWVFRMNLMVWCTRG